MEYIKYNSKIFYTEEELKHFFKTQPNTKILNYFDKIISPYHKIVKQVRPTTPHTIHISSTRMVEEQQTFSSSVPS